ncbi:flavin reductase family protein [Rhodobacter sp. HX-7-19]|uniref:Flavin reductase family protein n=1 Tax=Paragemmobacter kunshanensis TaxID=2583234 RepID=A0A6M1U8C7_9RHOB|nr:flavin reductase family protein [Rhodobacter kunshanensis]NGQ90301.1 flavin reductase family protein [Rhodobacter kunshanensis]
MDFDFTTLPPADRYRLLTNFIGPRPIALVGTRSQMGHNNAAPMSFFNVFSHEPPLVVLGIQNRGNGEEKDTVANIRRTGEFVVNMVDMALADAMIVCSVNFPAEVDELAFAGLTPVPCRQIDAARIGESPCAFECRVERILEYPARVLIVGEVLDMHVEDRCMDAGRRYVNPETYQPIARLHADNYITSDRQFELKKPDALLPYELAQITPRATESAL